MEENIKDRPWLLFLGVALLLIGTYGAFRTAVNLVAFEKYPIGGVLMFGLSQAPAGAYSYQRESDCSASYYYTEPLYYDKDNVTARPPTAEEMKSMAEQKKQTAAQLENCIVAVGEARDASKVNDLSQSLLFIFLGGAVLFGRKIFRHKSLNLSI